MLYLPGVSNLGPITNASFFIRIYTAENVRKSDTVFLSDEGTYIGLVKLSMSSLITSRRINRVSFSVEIFAP